LLEPGRSEHAIVAALPAGNAIVSTSLRSTTLEMDIADPVSICLLEKVDAVVCAGRTGNAKHRATDYQSGRISSITTCLPATGRGQSMDYTID
jgi:hypothetical protein